MLTGPLAVSLDALKAPTPTETPLNSERSLAWPKMLRAPSLLSWEAPSITTPLAAPLPLIERPPVPALSVARLMVTPLLPEVSPLPVIARLAPLTLPLLIATGPLSGAIVRAPLLLIEPPLWL